MPMNSDTIVEQIQKGFRVTLGATASLVEVLQDPDKREENIAKLSQDLSQLSANWAEKGEIAEQEARSFVDTILAQRQGSTSAPGTTAPPAPTAAPEVQLEIQELTAQLAAIRAELERLRNQDLPS